MDPLNLRVILTHWERFLQIINSDDDDDDVDSNSTGKRHLKETAAGAETFESDLHALKASLPSWDCSFVD